MKCDACGEHRYVVHLTVQALDGEQMRIRICPYDLTFESGRLIERAIANARIRLGKEPDNETAMQPSSRSRTSECNEKHQKLSQHCALSAGHNEGEAEIWHQSRSGTRWRTWCCAAWQSEVDDPCPQCKRPRAEHHTNPEKNP